MQIVLIDGIKDIVLHNGMLRVDCLAAAPNGEQQPSGTLLIPANVALAVVQTLTAALSELEKKIREQMESQAAAATAGQPA
jgi:hypothetical protein